MGDPSSLEEMQRVPTTSPPSSAGAPIQRPAPTGWLRLRVRADLHESIFWGVRARRALLGHQHVRVEVAIPRLEVELVRAVLDRRRWKLMAAERLEDRAGIASEPWVVVAQAPVPSLASDAALSRLGQRLCADLREARVAGPATVTVDAGPPQHAPVAHWTPEAVASQPGAVQSAGGPLPVPSPAARRVAGVHLFGSRRGVHAAWERLRRAAGLPPSPLERTAPRTLGPTGPPTRPGWWRETKPSVRVIGITSAWFVVAAATSQALARASADDLSGISPVWAQRPLLGVTLAVASIVALLTSVPCWIAKQRIARSQHAGDDPDSTGRFLRASRASILDVLDAGALSGRHRSLLWASSLALATAMGVYIGAMNVIDSVDRGSAAAFALFLAVSWAAFALARRLTRARGLVRGLSVGGLVLAFGHWRLYLYLGAMGIPASSVDVAPVDALTVALVPLALVALAAALATGFAFLFAGQPRPIRFIFVAAMALGAVAISLGSLAEAERTGRRAGVGLAVATTTGLKVTPGPTVWCLRHVDDGVPHDMGALPRPVWEVGARGDDVVLLSPEAASKAYPLPAGADPRTYVPAGDVRAPVWRVPRDRVGLFPSPPDPSSCAPPRPQP